MTRNAFMHWIKYYLLKVEGRRDTIMGQRYRAKFWDHLQNRRKKKREDSAFRDIFMTVLVS
jgi:hypothetical protein